MTTPAEIAYFQIIRDLALDMEEPDAHILTNDDIRRFTRIASYISGDQNKVNAVDVALQYVAAARNRRPDFTSVFAEYAEVRIAWLNNLRQSEKAKDFVFDVSAPDFLPQGIGSFVFPGLDDIPSYPTEGEKVALFHDPATGTNNWETLESDVDPGPGPGPIDDDAVNALIRAAVLDPAETGNTNRWPYDKLPTDVATDTQVTNAVTNHRTDAPHIPANHDHTVAHITNYDSATNAKVDAHANNQEAHHTPAQLASTLDTFIGNAAWRSRLSGQALIDAIDAATGANTWRGAHTQLRTAIQVRDLLDGLLGTAWRTGGGGGTGGITLDQATDAAGELLATLSFFTYDDSTNTLTADFSSYATVSALNQAVATLGSRIDSINPFTSADESKLDSLPAITSIGDRLTLNPTTGDLSADVQSGGTEATSALVSHDSGESGTQPTAINVTPQAATSVIAISLELEFTTDNRDEHVITLSRDGSQIASWVDDRNAARTNRVRTTESYVFYDTPNTTDEVTYLFTVPTHSATQDARYEIHKWLVSAVDYINVAISDLGTGLNQDQVDARITSEVLEFARDSAIDIPEEQVPEAIARQAAIDIVNSRLGHLERRSGGTLQLYHIGNGSEQYTQDQFAMLTAQNLTITGHIDDAELLPDGEFFLRIHNGSGGTTNKQGGNLQVLQNFGSGFAAVTRDRIAAGEIKFTFQISGPEMTAIFTDSSNQPIQAAFVEFDVGVGTQAVENNVLANFFLHLVGTGLTPEQAIAISRAGQGVLLAREEARVADGKASVAQEQNGRQDERLDTIEADGWVVEDRIAQDVKDMFGLDQASVDARITEQVPDSARYTDAKVDARLDAYQPIQDNTAAIADLQRGLRLEPNYFLREASATTTRDYIAHVNPSALPSGTTHLGMDIAGINARGRVEVATSGAYTFTFTAANIQTLSRVTRSTLQVDITFYDAASSGNDLGMVSDLLRVRDTEPSGGVEFGGGAGQIATWAEGDDTSDIPDTKLPFNIVQVTQAAYDALSSKDATTLYVVIG